VHKQFYETPWTLDVTMVDFGFSRRIVNFKPQLLTS
jgi:hypothetical protein